MKLHQFRIQNFRSIVDTGWCSISVDDVTALIGQNESGKTSILEALRATWTGAIYGDDIRRIDALPIVELKYCCEKSDWDNPLGSEEPLSRADMDVLSSITSLTFRASWHRASKGYDESFELVSPDPGELAERVNAARLASSRSAQEANQSTSSETPLPPQLVPSIAGGVLSDKLTELLPDFVFFSDKESLLPSEIDLPLDEKKPVPGQTGAQNFLDAAGIDTSILSEDSRLVESAIRRACDRLTAEFQQLWDQTIGSTNKIKFECELKRRDVSAGPEKAGRPYLAFWIIDGSDKIKPHQRSQGVKWFLSFFLQLQSSSRKRERHVFLIDEPGANLHSKAQKNVLKVIELVRQSSQIIYSTHSADLVEIEKLSRVLAVQRRDHEDYESPTIVMQGYELYTASADTLAPIYAHMGMDVSHQRVVKKSRNVLLEEPSGYYYFLALWEIFDVKEECYFVPGSGVTNIPMLANVFMGWGVHFLVVTDDDKQAREVQKIIRRDVFLDDEAQSQAHQYRIKDCAGIEDLFSPNDYARHILRNLTASIKEKNSDYAKKHTAKVLVAGRFLADVRAKLITAAMLDDDTRERCTSVLSEVTSRLNQLPRND